jgi:hypothetical protein
VNVGGEKDQIRELTAPPVLMFADIAPSCEPTMATKTKVDIDVDIAPDMLAAGLQVLVDSGVLDRGAARELPTGADVVLVAAIYKAMARAWHSTAAVEVTVPGVIEPGAELVVKNESDQPIRVVADPHETLTLKTRERPSD